MATPTHSSRAPVHAGKGNLREILIESVQVGNALRICAIDAATKTEVIFQAPTTAGRATIERLAKDKLDYVIKRGKA